MYLHLGGDVIIRSADVIAILDAAPEQKAREGDRFLQRAAAAGRLRDAGGGAAKSVCHYRRIRVRLVHLPGDAQKAHRKRFSRTFV